MKNSFNKAFFELALLVSPLGLCAEHFMYKPGWASNKTRNNEFHNMSVQAYVGGAWGSEAHNGEGKKVELLNLYGHEKIAYLFNGVDLSPLAGNLSLVAQGVLGVDLTNKTADYGALSYHGKFTSLTGGISFSRQITDHFGMKMVVPFHSFKVKDVKRVDLTPANELGGEHIQAMAVFDALLKAYNLSAGDVEDTVIGDMQMFSYLQYVREADDMLGDARVALTWGVTLPTSRQRKLDEAFYVPMGNNGHVGSNLCLDGELNVHSNVTLSVHGGAEMFSKRDIPVRMKTVKEQNGFIKLATGVAREKLGRKYDVNGGICLHDESHNYALGIQYRYERQGTTTLTPMDTKNFDADVVNSDEMLQSWQRHSICVKVAFAPTWDEQDHCGVCPRFMLHFTQPLKGKRIFNTRAVGGCLGLDFTWEF